MHGLMREAHTAKNGMGAKFIAQHLLVRTQYGGVVIVTPNPHSTISAIRKQWLRLVRKKQKERASTLGPVRIQRLVDNIAYMQGRKFTLKYPPDDYLGDIYIAEPGIILRWPPSCQTIYILSDLTTEQLHMITAWMPKNALVVLMRQDGE